MVHTTFVQRSTIITAESPRPQHMYNTSLFCYSAKNADNGSLNSWRESVSRFHCRVQAFVYTNFKCKSFMAIYDYKYYIILITKSCGYIYKYHIIYKE